MPTHLQRYEALRNEAQSLIRIGRFQNALELFSSALELARNLGDRELVDRAVCNRCRMQIELGPSTEVVQELAEIVLRTRDGETRFLATYHLARNYQLLKDRKKALFYGRIALDQANQLASADYAVDAHNVIGLTELASSYFDEASEQFEAALERLPQQPSSRRAILLDNLGYCYVVLGRTREGFGALFQSIRTLRRNRERLFERNTAISLCFAFIEVGKYRAAIRYGQDALRMAEEMEDAAAAKSALFLLGEATKLAGDDLAARRFFRRLQETYYPRESYLTEMLLVIDARTMVNLKA